jgi:hypothetical protein
MFSNNMSVNNTCDASKVYHLTEGSVFKTLASGARVVAKSFSHVMNVMCGHRGQTGKVAALGVLGVPQLDQININGFNFLGAGQARNQFNQPQQRNQARCIRERVSWVMSTANGGVAQDVGVFTDVRTSVGLLGEVTFNQEPNPASVLNAKPANIAALHSGANRDQCQAIQHHLANNQTSGGNYCELFFRLIAMLADVNAGVGLACAANSNINQVWPDDGQTWVNALAGIPVQVRAYHLLSATRPVIPCSGTIIRTIRAMSAVNCANAGTPGYVGKAQFNERIRVYVHNKRVLGQNIVDEGVANIAANANNVAITSEAIRDTIQWLLATTGDEQGWHDATALFTRMVPFGPVWESCSGMRDGEFGGNGNNIVVGTRRVRLTLLNIFANYRRVAFPAGPMNPEAFEPNFVDAWIDEHLGDANNLPNVPGAVPLNVFNAGEAPPGFALGLPDSTRDDIWFLTMGLVRMGAEVCSRWQSYVTPEERRVLMGAFARHNLELWPLLPTDNVAQRRTSNIPLQNMEAFLVDCVAGHEEAWPACGYNMRVTMPACSGLEHIVRAVEDVRNAAIQPVPNAPKLAQAATIMLSIYLEAATMRSIADGFMYSEGHSTMVQQLRMMVAPPNAQLNQEGLEHLAKVMNRRMMKDPRSQAMAIINTYNKIVQAPPITLPESCMFYRCQNIGVGRDHESQLCFTPVVRESLTGLRANVGGVLRDMTPYLQLYRNNFDALNSITENCTLSKGDRWHLEILAANLGQARCTYQYYGLAKTNSMSYATAFSIGLGEQLAQRSMCTQSIGERITPACWIKPLDELNLRTVDILEIHCPISVGATMAYGSVFYGRPANSVMGGVFNRCPGLQHDDPTNILGNFQGAAVAYAPFNVLEAQNTYAIQPGQLNGIMTAQGVLGMLISARPHACIRILHKDGMAVPYNWSNYGDAVVLHIPEPTHQQTDIGLDKFHVDNVQFHEDPTGGETKDLSDILKSDQVVEKEKQAELRNVEKKLEDVVQKAADVAPGPLSGMDVNQAPELLKLFQLFLNFLQMMASDTKHSVPSEAGPPDPSTVKSSDLSEKGVIKLDSPSPNRTKVDDKRELSPERTKQPLGSEAPH